MRILINMELDSIYADPDHQMGITESGYEMLCDLLGNMGTNIEVNKDGAA